MLQEKMKVLVPNVVRVIITQEVTMETETLPEERKNKNIIDISHHVTT
jgi:hypothetical protein